MSALTIALRQLSKTNMGGRGGGEVTILIITLHLLSKTNMRGREGEEGEYFCRLSLFTRFPKQIQSQKMSEILKMDYIKKNYLLSHDIR